MYANLNAAGQTKRDTIKVKDDQLQVDIDAAVDEVALKQLMVDGEIINVA
jgi:hypothetical protein